MKTEALTMTTNAPDAIPADVRRIAEQHTASPTLQVVIISAILADRSSLAAPVAPERIEMVSYETGFKEPAEPIWRIEIDGYCADFDTETAARNFAEAIDRRTAPSGTAEVEPWTREDLAESLARLDGIILKDIRSTVGLADDANNWREYLGRADDLLADLSLCVSTAAHPPTVEVRELYGWKCGCCDTVFTSSQGERSGGEFDAGAACPKCKAGGQYTYRCELHQGDPCTKCGVPHDDVPSGPCPGSPAPDVEVREPDAELVRALRGNQ